MNSAMSRFNDWPREKRSEAFYRHSRTEQLLVDTIESMQWMVDTMIWKHNQTGIEGNYGPELQKAIDTLDQLKTEQTKL